MARVYQTYTMGDAQVRAALVAAQGQADLLACRVSSWGAARGDALWYVTTESLEATVRIYFGPLGMAELLVCFVATPGMARWMRGHRLRGRLG